MSKTSTRLLSGALAIFGAVGLASCQGTLPTGTEPSPASPQAVRPTPVCFEPREILPFAFSPAGDELLLRTQSGIQFIDLDRGTEIAFVPSPQPLLGAAMSPDGRTLAWSLADNTIQLLRIPGGEVTATLEGHPDPVYDLLFDSVGAKLFSASHDGQVRVWDLAGNALPSVNAVAEVLGFGLSPDDTLLATIPSDGPIRLWNMGEGGEPRELGGTGGYDTSDAQFSPNGEYLAADLATGLYLWRLSDGELLWDEVKNSMAVAYSPDGRYLAYSDVDDGNKVFLASPDGSQVVATLDQMQAPIWEMFFSPDGSMLAATDGVEVRIWGVDGEDLRYVGRTDCP